MKEVMGHTLTNWQRSDKSEVRVWSQAPARERRESIVQEIHEAEDGLKVQKAAQQAQQGQWIAWEGTLQSSLTWIDIWKIAPFRLSLAIRLMYDLLQLGANLVKRGKSKMLFAALPSTSLLFRYRILAATARLHSASSGREVDRQRPSTEGKAKRRGLVL